MRSLFAVLVPLLFVLGAPASGAGSDGPVEEALASLRTAAREAVEDSPAPGLAAAVAVDGEVRWTEGFGLSHLDPAASAGEGTLFGLGSVTKALTMALCARLVQAGVLDWDAPLETYLPEFAHAGRGITVRRIGAHLSGMNDDWAAGLRFTMERFTTHEAYLEAVKAPLDHEPGTTHLYGTGTFTVIAEAVERITGKPFAEVMREEVLEPLGMAHTLPNDPLPFPPGCTGFYEPGSSGPERVEFNPTHKLAGAGYVATAADLVRFGSGLLDDGFLRPDLRAELFRDHATTDGARTGFGLGWRPLTDRDGRPVVHQSGGGPGISAWVVIYPEQRLVFAAVSNYPRWVPGARWITEGLDRLVGALESERTEPAAVPH